MNECWCGQPLDDPEIFSCPRCGLFIPLDEHRPPPARRMLRDFTSPWV